MLRSRVIVLDGKQVECSGIEFECVQPEQLDELCTDNTSPGESDVAINKREEIQASKAGQ